MALNLENDIVKQINKLSHTDMCRLWRFGNREADYKPEYFQGVYGQIFEDRLFNHFGGFTAEISKRLDWS